MLDVSDILYSVCFLFICWTIVSSCLRCVVYSYVGRYCHPICGALLIHVLDVNAITSLAYLIVLALSLTLGAG